MKVVMVSGCYDIIHGGHIEFFTQAKALGDRLVVSVAGDESLYRHKHRIPSMPIEHKIKVLQSLKMVDEVVVGDNKELGLDFKDHFLRIKPDVLAVTEDDRYASQKKELCAFIGAKYTILPKTIGFEGTSTSEIIDRIIAVNQVPLRIDFAGGWLDVPKFAVEGGFIVNCAITPMVGLVDWDFHIGGGLGGSAAYAILNGKNAVESELKSGVGWQDPAIIKETGLCVWKSGAKPHLVIKINPYFLCGKMGLLWTGEPHHTIDYVDQTRDYKAIKEASIQAAKAVTNQNYDELVAATRSSYLVQLNEGMKLLPAIDESVGCKYCGGGYGGYAVYLFPSELARNNSNLIKIEPFIKF
jgi:cytidyltransferase-like protein